MTGKVSGEDTWKFQPVNANFAEDYADTLKYVRSQTDLYYLNANFSAKGYTDIVDNFSDIYYPNIRPVQYNYTVMSEVDIAHEPEFITQENYDLFIENNPQEIKDKSNPNSLYSLFFEPATYKFYRIDHYEDVIDENTSEVVPSAIPRGFYYIKTKEDLKWCADRINGENYDNTINIVLGDDIGTDDDTPIKLNFALGENPEHPYEGILYGNGYSFKNININCNKSCNGIIGYLGYSGWADTIMINGDHNALTNRKPISITHLIDGEGDVAAGFLCGKNNGKITNVVVSGNLNVNSFYPKIYSIYNKVDNADTTETNLYGNMFYPDYLCFDSLGNIIPYIGYFNEGVFATLSGYNKNTGETETYWRTNITAYDGKGFATKIATDEVSKIASPTDWYYHDGFWIDNYGYAGSMNKIEDRKNILFYDTFIACQTNKMENETVFGFTLGASTIGLLPIDSLSIESLTNPGLTVNGKMYNIRKKTRQTNKFGLIENAPYLDKSIKLSQQNRAAYFVSPLIGINNSEVDNILINSNIITSGTFVGFIGGLAGKQLNGNIKNCMINLNSMDASGNNVPVRSTTEDPVYVYHKRDYYTQYRASQDDTEQQVYKFPLPSIKNIGGLFGECIAVGCSDALKVENITAYFNNMHTKVCRTSNAVTYLPEDYYLLDKFAGISPIIEFNTSNICDMWDAYGLLSPGNKLIKFKNLDITYNESLNTEDAGNETNLRLIDLYFKQVFNAHGRNAAKCQYPVATAENIYNDPDTTVDSYVAYPTTDGAASPLVCELKPVYLTSPSIIQTLFANMPYRNYSAYSADYTEKTYENAYDNTEGFECNSELSAENKYDFNILHSNNVGLYSMDQDLASPVSNPEFYGINLMTDLPGIQNPVSANIRDTAFDRFYSFDKPHFAYDIRKLFGKLIQWDNCKVSNNHDVWTHPDHASNMNMEYFTENNLFKYTVVPKAAQLPKHFSAYHPYGFNPYVYTASHVDLGDPDDPGLKLNDFVFSAGYNGNKIPYTYSYFGSDFTLRKNNAEIYNDMLSNIGGYRVYLKNTNYGAVYETDGNGEGWPDAQLGDFVSGFIVEVLIDDNNEYTYKASACYGQGHGTWVQPGEPDYDPEKSILDNYTQVKTMEYFDEIYADAKLDLDAPVDVKNKAIAIDDVIISNDNAWPRVPGFGSYEHNDNIGDHDIYYYLRHIVQIDADTVNNKKPLENMQFAHTLFATRRRDDTYRLMYAGENSLLVEKVELIKKRLPSTKYIVGYELDPDGAVSAIISSDTPPGLVSAYMKEQNYVSADIQVNPYVTLTFDSNTAICPANEHGVRIYASWTSAALTAVAEPPISAYNRDELYAGYDGSHKWNIPYKLYYKVGDENRPGGVSYTSAVWSAASGTIKYATGITVTGLLGLTEGFYLTAWTDINKQLASMPKESRVFNYVSPESQWEYLMAPGDEIEPTLPTPWQYQNKPGKYYVDYLGSTYDETAATGILYQNAKDSLSPIDIIAFVNRTIKNIKTGTDDEQKEFFKYTYVKGELSQNIGKAGFLVPVKYDEANNKAGFWFNMGETVDSAYNDDIHYTSNVFAIGKTPNQECILDQLRMEGISSVSFSGFTADDFDGLYVTDSDNNPVMYINVGLGECSEGTSWSYSSYPSCDDVSASGLILEVET